MINIKMEFARDIVFFLLLAAGVNGGSHQSPPPSTTCQIPAIYNFGDSNSDTGGIAAAFYPPGPPSGETFFQRPAGRASDGRLIIDFIAEKLGLSYLNAYLDSINGNYVNGANFATGGATIRRINESWFSNGVSPFSLDIQVEHFNQFEDRTTYIYNHGEEYSQRKNLPKPEDFAKAIYTIDIGQNDIAYGFRTYGVEGSRAAIPDIVNQFATSVQQLYGKGARAFWVHNTGPIGCLPVTYAKVHDPAPGYLDEIGCVKDQNDIAWDFNKQLKEKVNQLKSMLPEATLTFVDIYSAKYQLISTAKEQGFEDRFTICCGYHDVDDDVYCGNKGKFNGNDVFAESCKDPSKVISWDGVHYTEAANRWIATRIIDGSFSDPPLSITQTCPKQMSIM